MLAVVVVLISNVFIMFRMKDPELFNPKLILLQLHIAMKYNQENNRQHYVPGH